MSELRLNTTSIAPILCDETERTSPHSRQFAINVQCLLSARINIKITSLSTQLPHTVLSSFEKFSEVHSIFRSVFQPANFFVLISLFVVSFFLQCVCPQIFLLLFYSSVCFRALSNIEVKRKVILYYNLSMEHFLSFC